METHETDNSINALIQPINLKSHRPFIHTHSSKRIFCRTKEKMFQFILFVGFLCFSVGESSTTGAPLTTELTATSASWIMTSAPSTQQPGPSVITGLRIAVKSVVDLSTSSPEMEILVRQIETFIPSQYRATTSITVRKIERGSRI